MQSMSAAIGDMKIKTEPDADELIPTMANANTIISPEEFEALIGSLKQQVPVPSWVTDTKDKYLATYQKRQNTQKTLASLDQSLTIMECSVRNFVESTNAAIDAAAQRDTDQQRLVYLQQRLQYFENTQCPSCNANRNSYR